MILVGQSVNTRKWVGDVIISLTRRTEEHVKQLDQTVTLAEASELKDKEAAQAATREELSKTMSASSDGRSSEPPNRYHPYARKIRKETKDLHDQVYIAPISAYKN
ncbi:hypothetical protein COOONC_10249 [Cooperia oncophora]